jgi:selenocysteine-specific elongation factor
VEVTAIARGDTLCDRGAFEPTRRVDVSLDLLPEAKPLGHGARVRFHQGTTEVLGRVAVSGPRRADSDLEIYARVRLERPVLVTRGDRFIIRTYSPLATIGGGEVLDPQPPRGAIRTDAGRLRFARLDARHVDGDAIVQAFADERGARGLHMQSVVSRAGLAIPDAREAVARLVTRGAVTLIGDLIVPAGILTNGGDALLRAVQADHAAHPLSEGLPREEAREKVFRRAAPAVFEAIIDRLVASGRLVARERLALPGHQLSLSSDEARVRTELDRIFREAHLTPPDVGTAAAAAAASPSTAERMIALLVRSRTLVRIETLLFHSAALETLKADVRGLKSGEGSARVDVASFKRRYGVTRKYAIPLLEYLDRERVTRRAGEARIVL